jgi:uncharacterized protein YdeI (YjbR/CyaY-like superfamily)
MNKLNPKQSGKNSESRAPMDLRKALADTPLAETLWRDLTPIARRDFIRWITSAKQQETRKHRIGKACDMLMTGKRRPCCYAVVPMNLYKALATHPKAKAQWSTLTPDERRDFIDWLDSAKNPESYKDRIEKVCVMLMDGKQRLL